MPNTGPAAMPEYDIPIEDIQGNITPGFKRDHQAFVFLRFPDDPQSIRDWIAAMTPHVTDAKTVAESRQQYRAAQALAKKDDASATEKQAFEDLKEHQEPWFNVAFTYAGLEKLGTPDREKLSVAFQEGMSKRRFRLQMSDRGVENWRVRDGLGSDPIPDAKRAKAVGRIAHAVLIAAASSVEKLQSARDCKVKLAKDRGLEVCGEFRGATLTSKASQKGTGGVQGAEDTTQEGPREQLGFADGISQPDPKDILTGKWRVDADRQVVAPGELILGCEPEERPGFTPAKPPPFAEHGSYMVLMRIRQDVQAFKDAVAAEATRLHDEQGVRPMNAKLLEAKIIGRWPSGMPLEQPRSADDRDPSACDPGRPPNGVLPVLTEKDFKTNDEYGLGCPLFAHIRRAHPRANKEASLHRIIRRGITYQEGDEKGLLFVAYQASLTEGFEAIQQSWLAKAQRIEDSTRETSPQAKGGLQRILASLSGFFSGAANRFEDFLDGLFVDAQIGTGDLLNAVAGDKIDGNKFGPTDLRTRSSTLTVLGRKWLRPRDKLQVTIPVHTSVDGGGYFFAPSKSGLAVLAADGGPE